MKKKVFFQEICILDFFDEEKMFSVPLEKRVELFTVRVRLTDTAARENKQTCLYARSQALNTNIFSLLPSWYECWNAEKFS